MKDTQWYVEATGLANENICAHLRATASGPEPESVSHRDTTGVPHAVLRITKDLLKRLKQMKREEPAVYGSIKFWVQHTHDGRIEDASFLEKKTVPAKVAAARKQALALKQKARRIPA